LAAVLFEQSALFLDGLPVGNTICGAFRADLSGTLFFAMSSLVDNELKSSIFVEIDDLRITGSSKCSRYLRVNTCYLKNKLKITIFGKQYRALRYSTTACMKWACSHAR
jgi:hypothetical protein